VIVSPFESTTNFKVASKDAKTWRGGVVTVVRPSQGRLRSDCIACKHRDTPRSCCNAICNESALGRRKRQADKDLRDEKHDNCFVY